MVNNNPMQHFGVFSRGGAGMVAIIKATDSQTAYRLKSKRKLPDANYNITESEYTAIPTNNLYPAHTDENGNTITKPPTPKTLTTKSTKKKPKTTKAHKPAQQ